MSFSGPAIGTETATYDPRGLKIRSQREEFDKTAVRSYIFDRFGLVRSVGYPADASLTNHSTLFVTYDYDGLGRVTKVTRPGATAQAPPYIASFSYSGRTTSYVSERGVVSDVVRDAKGRVFHSETEDGDRQIAVSDTFQAERKDTKPPSEEILGTLLTACAVGGGCGPSGLSTLTNLTSVRMHSGCGKVLTSVLTVSVFSAQPSRS